jgi:hypothetical protein
MPAHAVFDKLVECNRQFAVISAGVASVLDFESIEDATGSKAQHPIGWRFQHLDGAGRELPGDAIGLSAHAAPRRLA